MRGERSSLSPRLHFSKTSAQMAETPVLRSAVCSLRPNQRNAVKAACPTLPLAPESEKSILHACAPSGTRLGLLVSSPMGWGPLPGSAQFLSSGKLYNIFRIIGLHFADNYVDCRRMDTDGSPYWQWAILAIGRSAFEAACPTRRRSPNALLRGSPPPVRTPAGPSSDLRRFFR